MEREDLFFSLVASGNYDNIEKDVNRFYSLPENKQ
jgi:hypothetical protein